MKQLHSEDAVAEVVDADVRGALRGVLYGSRPESPPQLEAPPYLVPRSTSLRVRRATEADAHALAPRLCDADYAKAKASQDQEPLTMLRRLVRARACYSVDLSGTVVTLCGAIDLPGFFGAVGCPFRMSSEDIRLRPVEFLRVIRVLVDATSRAYPLLYGFTRARYKQNVRWLELAGFRPRLLFRDEFGELFTSYCFPGLTTTDEKSAHTAS